MNAFLKKLFVVLLLLLFLSAAIFVAALAIPPVGNVVFSIVFGSAYREVGEAAFNAPGYPATLAVYKHENKPFLIVGPVLFRDDGEREDFFFVNKTQVVRTATDKGGEIWCRTAKHLHILDDLSDCEILRAPWWDELKCTPEASVKYDIAADSYIYSFALDNNSLPTTLTISAKFFTPDMERAPNRTHE